jgi:2-(1,2-epoxy-1,2-dihydrophenyl)acetyl-CoA isomerase
MDEVVRQRDGGVVRIELNRPSRRNALTAPVVQALIAALSQATAAYGDTRVVVLAGAPPGFCAGADRSALAFLTAPETTDADRLAELRAAGQLVLALQRFPGPTIAEVAGAAVGGGCNLALACDLAYAAQDARFGQVFVRHGLALDMGGSWLLSRLAGPRAAAELAFSGRIVSAAEALSLGLVNAVVPADALRAVVAGQAAELARMPAGALAAIKSQLRHGLTHDLAASLEFEAQAQNARLRDLPHLGEP